MASVRTDLREMLHEIVEYRELLLRFTTRDLMVRYKQTVMGFGWALFMPVVNTLLFSVIFTRVAPLDTGQPYPLFAYCGLMFWNYFAASLRASVSSLTSNGVLVSKVYFPREIIPFSAVLVCLVDLAVSALILVGMMAYYHVTPTWSILLLPFVLVIQTAFAAGCSLLLSMANLFYRDVKYLFEAVLMVWMFATSVVYPASAIGGRLGDLMQLNPMTPIIEAYRTILLDGAVPSAGPLAAAALLSFLVLGVGWLVFHRAEYRFAESV